MCSRSKLLLSFFLASPALALAQPPAASAPATQAQIAALQQAVQNAQSAGDNAWMLVSAALVLLMTGPGLALFYGGLVRRKNILGTMMQSFAMMGLVTILWAIVGYSLAFGHGNGFIGGFEHLFLQRRGADAESPIYAATIPEQTYMVYQLMFAIITPALITGAFAERMKFSAMAVFLSLWSLLVYCPMAHMVWGVGGLLNAAGGHIPSLDFAGGTVVHITSGVSALVPASTWASASAIRKHMPPHSMVLSFIGACMLWVGWFGFNAGSALARKPAGDQRLCQHPLCRSRGGAGLDVAEWIHNGKPTALGAISGAVAGLVAITPASGFVQPLSALAIGLIAGVFCSFMVFKVKSRLRL